MHFYHTNADAGAKFVPRAPLPERAEVVEIAEITFWARNPFENHFRHPQIRRSLATDPIESLLFVALALNMRATWGLLLLRDAVALGLCGAMGNGGLPYKIAVRAT